MKKRLFASLILTTLLLTSCFERDLPLIITVPDTTADSANESETLQPQENATNETTADEATATDEPDDLTETVISNEYIEIKKLPDGKYTCVRSNISDHIAVYDDVHILEYLDGNGNLCQNYLLSA